MYIEYNGLQFGKNHDLKILSAVGFGLPPEEYTVKSVIGVDGEVTTNSAWKSRTITIGFDIQDDIRCKSNRICRAFSVKNLPLRCFFENDRRSITVNRIVLEEGDTNGPIRSFAVQLICDFPFFTDESENVEPCYGIIKNIKYNGGWNLAQKTVWGESVNRKIIHNSGDIKTEPKFIISSTGTPSATYGVRIINHTTSQEFMLNYQISDSETVTIDFNPRNESGKRRIISSVKGDITNYRDDNSSMSNFYLAPGDNDIEFKNLDAGIKIHADITWKSLFYSAFWGCEY